MAPGNSRATIVRLVNDLPDSDLKNSLQRLVHATGQITNSVENNTLVLRQSQSKQPQRPQPQEPSSFTNHEIHPALFAVQAQEQLNINQRQAQQSSNQGQPLEDMIDPRLKDFGEDPNDAMNPLLNVAHHNHEYHAFQQLANYAQPYAYGQDHSWNPPAQQGQYYGDPAHQLGQDPNDPRLYQQWQHQQMGQASNEAGDLMQPEIYQWEAGETQSGYAPEQPQIPRYRNDAKLPPLNDIDQYYGHHADGSSSMRTTYYTGQ